jgi:hypothetical protein
MRATSSLSSVFAVYIEGRPWVHKQIRCCRPNLGTRFAKKKKKKKGKYRSLENKLFSAIASRSRHGSVQGGEACISNRPVPSNLVTSANQDATQTYNMPRPRFLELPFFPPKVIKQAIASSTRVIGRRPGVSHLYPPISLTHSPCLSDGKAYLLEPHLE